MKRALLACMLCVVFTPRLVWAARLPDDGLSLSEVAEWLQEAGYRAQIMTKKDGSKDIVSAADGGEFHIRMYDCNNNTRCPSLHFYAGFSTNGAWNAEKINEWNRNNRWGQAYVDDSNDPFVDMDVDISPGGTYEMLNDAFATWRMTLRSFRKFIKW